MVDEFEILGVARDATEKEVRTAYSVRMLACSRDTSVERTCNMQLIREAYKILRMKLAHTSRNLALRSTHEAIGTGLLCRCGSRYSLEDLQDNIVECQSCSCYVILE